MDKKKAEELLNKYLEGNCTNEEKLLVERSYNVAEQEFPESDFEPDYSHWNRTIKNQLPKASQPIFLWPRVFAAASIVICIGIGFYFYQKNSPIPTEITAKNDIAPGGNKAFLTLANGKRITLTDAKNGELAEQSRVKITKAADGQLIYTASNISNENYKINAYNIIETPRGGTYQVRLPDGTKVWLNAASTIKYPVSFTSSQARKVFLLSGEAYFEVAKDKKHPFIVKSSGQEVKVLGTHFNVNTYADEGKTTTALLEGSVSIASGGKLQILKPGERAICAKNKMSKVNGGVEDAIAWKDGLFKFENADVKTVFRQIARWYDVDVNYEGDIKQYNFTGEIYRNLNLSETLRIIRFTGLKFKVERRNITVTNQK